MFNKLTSRKYLPISGIIVAGIILILTLFVFQIGVEDNGTLGDRLSQMGLYDISAASGSGFYSQHLGVANKTVSFVPSQIIYTLCKQFFGVDTVMNTMFPAAVYAIIYILGLFFLFKSIMTDIKWSNILTVVICLFIFCDTAYISYFNTPYSYASTLAFLPLFFASVVSAVKYNKLFWFVITALCGVFVFGSTCVMGVAGILFGIYFIILMFRNKSVVTKVMCGLCVVSVIISSFFVISDVSYNSLFDSTFYGVLYENPDYASKLGLDEYKEYAGVPSFTTEAQELISSEKLDGNLSYSKNIFGYLKKPQILYKNTSIAANNGTMVKTAYLGNFTPSSGKSSGSVSNFFAVYSMLKAKFIPNKLIVLLLILIFICYFSVVYKNKYAKTIDSKVLAELSVLSALCSMLLIPAIVVFYGITQISFNMFVFNILFDISVIFAVLGGTKILWIKRQILKEEYGVNQ